jgi:hypothetical protein
MRPGQTSLNELEEAILLEFAAKLPSLKEVIPALHVSSREFTGVGFFTNFEAMRVEGLGNQYILGKVVHVPRLESGLTAVLMGEAGEIDCLEVVANGELWDGRYDGFAIEQDT